MNKILYTFLFIVLSTVMPGQAQSVKQLSTAHGLSNRKAFMTVKGNNGYIWIATRMGIDRYNGESIKQYCLVDTFSRIKQYPIGIINNRKSGLYAFSRRKIYRYDSQRDCFYLIPDMVIEKSEYIQTINIDPQGLLWIATSEHLYTFNLRTREKVTVRKGSDIQVLYFANEYQGWIGDAKGVQNVSSIKGAAFQITDSREFERLNKVKVMSLFFDPKTQYLWIGTFTDGLFVYDTKLHRFVETRHTKTSHPIRSITKVRKEIWVGVDGAGIQVYQTDARRIKEYNENQTPPNQIPENSVYHIMNEDNQVWVSTYNKGVYVFNKNHLVTRVLLNKQYHNNTLINSHANYILEDRQKCLWIGTNRGVNRYNPATNEWTYFTDNALIEEKVILAIYEDSAGRIWIGGYGGHVCYIDAQDRVHSLDKMVKEPIVKSQQYTFSIYEDSEGVIYFGGIVNHLFRYNPQSRAVVNYPITNINAITQLNKDTLLMAYIDNVLLFDIGSGQTKVLTRRDGSPIAYSNVHALTISPTSPQELWIGTEGNGVIRYNMHTDVLKQYTTQNGLSSDDVCSLQMDHLGHMWAGTEYGLNCINPESHRIISLYETDGLPSNTFCLRSSCALQNDRLLFGTTSGVVEIDPKDFSWLQKEKSNLRIEDFYIFNKAVLPGQKDSPLHKSIHATKELRLAHNQNSFTFNFIDVNGLNQKNEMYSWYLEGFDKEWSLPSKQHKAIYTNIPPGNYQFYIKLIDQTNKMAPIAVRKLGIVIAQPWWNTPWAWMVYTMLGAILVGFIIKYYKNEQDIKDSDKKIRFFVDLAHDLRTPLTLIKAPLNDIQQEGLNQNAQNALSVAQRHVESLLNMVGELLDFQKLERNSMVLEVEQTNIQSYILNIVGDFQLAAQEKQVTIETKLPPADTDIYIDQKKLKIVLNNLLSNAVKYTCQGGLIQVKVWLTGELVHLEISDNGIGIPKSEIKNLFTRFYRSSNAMHSTVSGSGIGLLLVKKIIELHKGEINIVSTEGKGTAVTMSIPCTVGQYHEHEVLVNIQDLVSEESLLEDDADQKTQTKILVVEDNDEIRSYLRNLLSRKYEVLESNDGKVALELVQKEELGFIVSDVNIPSMTGFELCKAIKSDIATCHIPILLLTGLDDTENMMKGFKVGADAYMTKPFEPNLLLEKMNSVLNNRNLMLRKSTDPKESVVNQDGLHELDKEFISKVIEIIENDMQNEEFTIDSLASDMAMSRSLFFKKLKALTAQNPQEFIRDIKMKRAAKLLKEGEYSIAEIAYRTGYPNAKYFSTTFKKYFGVSPSKYG